MTSPRWPDPNAPRADVDAFVRAAGRALLFDLHREFTRFFAHPADPWTACALARIPVLDTGSNGLGARVFRLRRGAA